MTPFARLVASTWAAALPVATPALAVTGDEVLQTVCSTCHVTNADGSLERIDSVRKTPEAWDMTVQRMMRNHAVVLTPEQRTAVVRTLADTRGLSVAETRGWRYVLDREPVSEDAGPTQLMTETCGRCHSFARVALQRRTADDWAHLVNFHLGQFPTLEYQALARDRDWWGIAQSEIIPYLAEHYPLGDRPARVSGDLAGRYVVAGHQPGRGSYHGTLDLAADAGGHAVTMTLDFPDGQEIWQGTGVVYGAGEWRATLKNGDRTIRQVMALEGEALSGRWFLDGEDVTGGRIEALRETAAPRILSVAPSAIRAGATTEVRLTGVGLSGAPVLPEGVQGKVLSASATEVVLALTTPATPGVGGIGVGPLTAPEKLVVYDRLDRLTVVPEVEISRIGGNGGPIPKVPAQFEAVGWLNGPDAAPATDDDIRVGVVPAEWRVAAWSEAAAEAEDVKYAGSIDQTGRFTPAGAGPNPARVMGTNNVGDLKVLASIPQEGGPLTAEAHLYATVQRFVDAAIR